MGRSLSHLSLAWDIPTAASRLPITGDRGHHEHFSTFSAAASPHGSGTGFDQEEGTEDAPGQWHRIACRHER
ncbi:hypothetical protein TBR22_A04800 [Luteitalea sp. TBR-22]|nr:hypothetical protein TBR22_A04800 [Luteitalea sp. TBR-22]